MSFFTFTSDNKIELNSQYHRACVRGDKAQALRLLDEGADINTTRTEIPAILSAVYGEFWDLAIELIKRKVDVNCYNSFGASPLHFTAAKGHEELTKMILDELTSVNRMDDARETPLFMAVKNNHKSIVSMLLAKGADVSISNKKLVSVGHLAARNGDIEMIDILFKAGARFDLPNAEEKTPIQVAKDPSTRTYIENLVLKTSVAQELHDRANPQPDTVNIADIDASKAKPEENEVKPKRRIMKV